jgi:hypothetical protein
MIKNKEKMSQVQGRQVESLMTEFCAIFPSYPEKRLMLGLKKNRKEEENSMLSLQP